MKKNLTLFFAFLLALATGSGCQQKHEITHGNISVELLMDASGHLGYIVRKAKQTVIDTARLGISINGKNLGENTEIGDLSLRQESFAFPLLGVKDSAKYNGTEGVFQLRENDRRLWNVTFKVSPEGVAFRYDIPAKGTSTIGGEASAFRLPAKTKVWYFERESDWKLRSHAGTWLRADIEKMPKVSKNGPVQGLTLTCELPGGGYALLAEADLFDYSGLRLKAVGNRTLTADFSEGKKGFKAKGNIQTPWRCVALADDLNDLVNNTFIPALNPAPDSRLFADKAWIKPGKAAWFWWSGNEASFEDEWAMVDKAHALGLEYTMVDDGWESWPNKWESARKLARHAEEKGVKLFLWKHSKEIRNLANDYVDMSTFLDSVKAIGAVGVKVDFMNGHSKTIIDFDETLLRKAAEHQLMVNFHGCQQSSGEYRTYPNEVTREGVRGTELNKMGEGPVTASHNAALPFTRLVAGHADYTPLALTAPGETTWAHQLATLVCFYSPFQCLAENPEFLLTNPRVKPALDFIRNVPSVWDETRVLPGSSIGETAIIARRKNQEWYIGILNAGEAKAIELNPDFLDNETYQTELFSDDLEGEKIDLRPLNPLSNLSKGTETIPFKKESIILKKGKTLRINLAPKGGAVITLKPA
ncbi:alpha-glucosidase [Fulvitalea axinellae]|uniref:Alpha-glucosidase n=1 Tax=Fulvitalea axinellae TaxID=1182444 RepID=A0AAU9CIB1_9BACT|nr:alpha-glucosidase [Fulvitalea axinellae]